jgi:hypothetical protein
MARIQEVVPIRTITIFPGAPEENGCQEKSEVRDSVVLCLSEMDNMRRDVLCANGIQAVAVDGEMIKAFIQTTHRMGGHVEFSGIEGTG